MAMYGAEKDARGHNLIGLITDLGQLERKGCPLRLPFGLNQSDDMILSPGTGHGNAFSKRKV